MSLTKGTLQSNRGDLKVCDRAYGEIFFTVSPAFEDLRGISWQFLLYAYF